MAQCSGMTPERLTLSVQVRGKLKVMRVGAALLVGLAVLAAGATSIGGAGAASHRAGKAALQNATSPSWSPDGKQIAFAYVGHGSYRIVRRSSRPGGAVRTVLVVANAACCSQLTWVPGGRIFVDPAGGHLWSVDLHGGKRKPIDFSGTCRLSPCSPGGFILSPSREYAAVTTTDGGSVHSPEGIQLLKLNPRRAPVVVRTPFSGENSDSVLAFSPDSKQLVYWSCQNYDPYYPPAACLPGLMAARIPGGTPVPLAQSGIPGAARVPTDVWPVQWSPDGRWIAFVEGPAYQGHALEVVPTTGAGASRVLATCSAPDFLSGLSWSPTSKLIAFDCTSPVDGSAQLMTVSPDGTHLTNLLNDRPLAYRGYYSRGEPTPQWSPDGSRLLFLAHGIGHRTVHVWTIRPNGHNLTRLG
jgi:Tol biopolymer transport system component